MQADLPAGYGAIFYKGLTIRTPANLSLRLPAYDPLTEKLEKITLTTLDELSVRVETKRHLIEINYYEDPNDPNGQITVSEKFPGSDVPSWSANQNSVPKEVIVSLIALLKDERVANLYLDPEANGYATYGARNNGNGNNGNGNNGNNYNGNGDPIGNNNTNSNSNDPIATGGRRRKRGMRKTRRTRR